MTYGMKVQEWQGRQDKCVYVCVCVCVCDGKEGNTPPRHQVNIIIIVFHLDTIGSTHQPILVLYVHF